MLTTTSRPRRVTTFHEHILFFSLPTTRMRDRQVSRTYLVPMSPLPASSSVSDEHQPSHDKLAAPCADEVSRRFLKRIEHDTGKTVSIRPNAPTACLRLAVNRQHTSHFFRLPPELRIWIYERVFAPRDDAGRPYKTAAPYYRPGCEAHHVTEIAFLFTCRRICLEANHLPLEFATQTF